MVGRRRAFTIATLVISSVSGPHGLSCEAGAAFSTNDEAKERDDVGDERTGIECPRRHVPEWSDDKHHVVCRASDGSMNWVCPKLWSRTPIDQPTPPYCIPPKARPSFAEFCRRESNTTIPSHVAIFIRTYHGDLAWLPYVLRSVCAFGGDVASTVVVAFPDVDAPLLNAFLGSTFPWVVTVATNTSSVFHDAMMRRLDQTHAQDREVIEWRMKHYDTADAETIIGDHKMAHPGYAAQIYDKICSDLRVPLGTQYILHMDSDVVLHRHLRWSDVFADGNRPRLERELWARVGAGAEERWRESTVAALKLAADDPAIEYDYMRRIGNTYPVELFRSLRREIETLHGVHDAMTWFVTRAASHLGFPASEFELLGVYAFKHFHGAFEWSTCGDPGHETWETCQGYFPIVQGWSWGGLRADTIAFYECILQQHTAMDGCRHVGIELHDAQHHASTDEQAALHRAHEVQHAHPH